MGIYFSTTRNIANGTVCCYALILFIVVAIPLLVEGGAILELDRISVEELHKISEMNLDEVKGNYSLLTYEVIREGIRYDLMSDMVLDTYMCSRRTCPCQNYRTPADGMTADLWGSEELLRKHGRTRKVADMFKDEYVYFTDDLVERGFRSVHECFEAWNSTVFNHQFEDYEH